MKVLLLIRHAKTEPYIDAASDFLRRLTRIGEKNAREISKRLKEKSIYPDYLISSPAVRAKSTCEIFAEEFGLRPNKIDLQDRLYMPSFDSFENCIAEIDESIETVAIFSHNPTITEFGNSLCRNIRIDNMPTCSVFGITSEAKNWKVFKDSEKIFLLFEKP